MYKTVSNVISVSGPTKVALGMLLAAAFIVAAVALPYGGFETHENGTAQYSPVLGSVAEATGGWHGGWDKEVKCTISVNPASIEAGESAVISWTTENADSVTIDEGIESVANNGSISVAPDKTTSYLLEAKSKHATAKCHITITVKEPPAGDPLCALDIDDSLITEGESVTLTWTTENADSVELDGETVSADGSKTILIEEPKEQTFTLTVTGVTGETEICMQDVRAILKPMCELAADPTNILLGESTTLTWTSENAAEAFYGEDSTSVPVNGSQVETPATVGTHDFKVMVQNEDGWCEECQAFVVVKDEGTPDELSCDAFAASPDTFTESGTTTLTWETTGATEVTIDNGIGPVDLDGSEDTFVDSDTTFVLTATDGVDTVTCEASMNIEPVVNDAPQCLAFSVSNSPVDQGKQITLSWETENATGVSINQGIGTVAANGNRTVTANTDTTYVLTAANASGTDICEASVKVTTGGGGGGGSSSPRCEFIASTESIREGEEVTLSWDNLRTNDILIEDSRGNILVDTEEDLDIDEDEDSISVSPTQTTTYTLTALRGSQDRECDVTISVEDDVTVSSSRSQDPLVAGISLSNVPYTGFEAGPILTSVFYALLIIWALGVAYFLVFKNGNAMTVGAYGAAALHTQHDTAPEAEDRPETEEDTEASHAASFVATEAPANLPVTPETAVDHTEAAGEVVLGDETGKEAELHDEMVLIENRAHETNTLLSSDAIRFIIGHGSTTDERLAFLDTVIEEARTHYPSEDGWVVINKERLMALFA